MRGTFRGNIVVSNLPEGFGDEDLAGLFDTYGLVLGARIDRDHPDPVQARRGVVALAPSDRVEEAVQAMNGHRIDTYKLKVRKLPEPPPKPQRKPQAAMRLSAPPRLERPVVVVRQRLAPRRLVMASRET
jgi:hypothetical protein